MLSHRRSGWERSVIELIMIVDMNGRIPHTRVSVRYLPVRCMTQLQESMRTGVYVRINLKKTYPAKMEPIDMEIPLGIRCAPEIPSVTWRRC